jgi:glutamyl-tRNA(Gln) amidotransferase subunit E
VKAGLEVHQQLATGRKLFCACPPDLTDATRGTFVRRLRATGGEDRSVDPAARAQSERGLLYRYEATETSCLVDADEEPPHALDPESLEIGLTVALALHARVLDEIEVMRKIVVDGSNTSGFQRTALLAVDGWMDVGDHRISIPTVCLEEDAARRVGRADPEAPLFRLDRLGIPLVEVSTGPDIRSGAEAREVAEELGALLRATRRVRRGIGTIREDLNVSIEAGARVEIKGVQELRLIEKYVEGEAERQRRMLETRERLIRRGAAVESNGIRDLTDALRGRWTGRIGDRIGRGELAWGIKLSGFAGALGRADREAERLGRELADYARAAGVKGILHSDELPVEGFESGAEEAVRRALAVGAEDAFVLVVAADGDVARRALEAVLERARAALHGVPTETRDPLPDGRTRYSRPLPGRDRMYPETDVPPILVDPEFLRAIERRLPEPPESVRARLMERHGLSREIALGLVREDEAGRFESLVEKGYPPALVARLLTRDLPEARAQRPETSDREPNEAELAQALDAVRSGAFAKEALASVLAERLRGASTIEEAARAAGLRTMSSEELERLARSVVARNAELVRSRGMSAMSGLMGEIMREVRGRRDGREVSEALKRALADEVRASSVRAS